MVNIKTPHSFKDNHLKGIRKVPENLREYAPYTFGTLNDLKTRKYLGSSNTCPKCKQKGNFGSILTQMEADGSWYMICGWCGNVERLTREQIKNGGFE